MVGRKNEGRKLPQKLLDPPAHIAKSGSILLFFNVESVDFGGILEVFSHIMLSPGCAVGPGFSTLFTLGEKVKWKYSGVIDI